MPLPNTASYQEVLDKLGDLTGVNQKAELIAAVTDKGGVVPASPSTYDVVKALVDIAVRTDTITPGTTNKAIPKGFHSGLGIVQGSANLIAENIKKDVNIFGVVGTSGKQETKYLQSSNPAYTVGTIQLGVGRNESKTSPNIYAKHNGSLYYKLSVQAPGNQGNQQGALYHNGVVVVAGSAYETTNNYTGVVNVAIGDAFYVTGSLSKPTAGSGATNVDFYATFYVDPPPPPPPPSYPMSTTP